MTSPSARQLKRSWRYARPGVLLKNEIAGDPRGGSNYAKEYRLLADFARSNTGAQRDNLVQPALQWAA